jgi:hypothetical protein
MPWRLLVLLVPGLAYQVNYIPYSRIPPSSREYSVGCIDSASSKFYIFGGHQQAGELLNDLWAFDLASNYWEEMKQSSINWPQARITTACLIDQSERVLYIFGGETENTFLNDLWAFSLTTKTVTCKQWEQKTMKGNIPPPTSKFASAKYVKDGKPKLAITAGMTIEGYFTDVYV